MTRERILTEDEDFITTEDGEYIHLESSDMTTGTATARRAVSPFKPSTFWKKYWYFYDKKGNRRRR